MTKHPDQSKVPGWNYTPDLPLQVSPFFSWPPEPRRMVQWLAARWLKLAENTVVMLLALVSWVWFQPSLDEIGTLAFGWIFEIWLRNMILVILVAGGLHWFFYRRKLQQGRLKFDPRKLMYKGKQFTFGGALLHKSADGQATPFPGHTYPTALVTGMPIAVKPFMTATRI